MNPVARIIATTPKAIAVSAARLRWIWRVTLRKALSSR